MLAALRTTARRVQRAFGEPEIAGDAPRGFDLEPFAAGPHAPLHVAQVFLQGADRQLEIKPKLLEVDHRLSQSRGDLLPSCSGPLHGTNCTDHHVRPQENTLVYGPPHGGAIVFQPVGYIEYVMTEAHSSMPRTGLSEPVRLALLELVEKGFASPQNLRKLGSEGHRMVTGKAELMDSLDRRIGTEGLTVTAGILTNLAVVNQIYGFDIGDVLQELIQATTEVVLRGLDPDARIAQIAGAQFVILHGSSDSQTMSEIVHRLQRACNSVALNRHRRSVAPRVAMVSLEVPGDDDLDATEVLKILGYSQLRTRPSHLEPVILRGDMDHRQWRTSVRQREAKAGRIMDALRRGAVEVHFQPVIELATRNLYNVEVLARIRTDDGLMTATEFIDSVYQLGEIVELDSQVFARLNDAAQEVVGVTGHLFINVSPVSLLSADFRDLMSTTMNRLRGEGLGMVVVLELTEQAIVEHLDIIQELHTQHDIKFAVDDFGTGYSSLKTVSDLAVSKVISHLKLDGSLVREIEHSPEAYKVVLAIANLAKSLDLKVVAEHVESEGVLERLRTIGVDLGQGRLFDMPLSLPGLVEGYRERPQTLPTPAFNRPALEQITPYLDKAFNAFYDRILSNDHFRSFFRDSEQIRNLVERQRASFIESMSDDEDQLRERYIALGHFHHTIGVPFPSFMKGAEILNEELLAVLSQVGDKNELVFRSSLFFKQLRNLLARGYLDGVVAEEELDLGATLDRVCAALNTARAPSLDWVRGLVEAVRLDHHDDAPRPSAAVDDAVEWLSERIVPLLPKDSATSIIDAYRCLHADGDSLAFFLGEREYPSVMMLYRQLHDRVASMHRSLQDAGLA